MLARKHRFHGHRSVQRVRGGSVRMPHFTVFFMHTKREDFRMAVIVSKKTAKSAVVRNRIRRRLYEAVRTGHFLDGKPVDTVFVAKSESLATLPASELAEQVEKACKKIPTKPPAS